MSKCRPHMEPSGIPRIRPPMLLGPERPRLPVMTVNGVKPDANGDVAVDLSGIVELKGKVARLDEAVSEETRRAVGAEEELSRSISSEATRAQTAEQGLRNDVLSVQSAVDDRVPYANSGKTSLVVGTGNDNHDKGSVAIFGARNNVQSGYTLVGGYGNSLDDGSNGSIVGGYNNEVHGKRNIVGGGSNTTGSTEGKNTVTGSDMIVSGRDNNASGSFSIVSGQGNSVTGDRELFIGQGLKGQYNNGALLGQYNYPLNGVRFSIGCGGSDSTRQNALVLTDDGALYLKGVGGYNGTTFVGASSLAIALNYIGNYLVRDEITGALALGYNSSTKELQLTYEGDRVSSIDAKAFIKDGMVSNVAIENGSIVITFNTDAGKEPISIPLTDVFNPANYYNKTDSDNKFATKTELGTHTGNSSIHITAQERDAWNAKQGALPLEVGDPDKAGSLKLSVSGSGANTANNTRAVALGYGLTVSGNNAFAANNQNTASGENANAFGYQTKATGRNSHTDGNVTVASGSASHAEGNGAKATGGGSHAEGHSTEAKGDYSHAEGTQTQATALNAHAEGALTKASAPHSHAEGRGTETTNPHEHAEGQYNVSHTGAISSIGIGSSDTDRKNAVTVMLDGRVFVNGVGGYAGTETALTGKKSLQTVIDELPSSVQLITWSDLRTLRDAGGLKPGQQYRITDYVATTNGNMDSRSANHPFDIIVTADDERTLNEHARAIIHDGELPDDLVDGETRTGYFANCDLAAWDVWYCIDNDTDRFAWADATNGKGVIYRLVDEFQNDAPYDFKGLQFRRWAVTDVTSTRLDADSLYELRSSFVKSQNGGLYYARQSSDISVDNMTLVVDGSDSVWYYTFGGAEDLSLTGLADSVYANEIAEYGSDNKRKLNNIVFLGSGCYDNTFGSECSSNTFGLYCSANTFGSECSSNTFDSYCSVNTFGPGCGANTFGSGCGVNTFGPGCGANTFGPGCYDNTFDSSCNDNTFGSFCASNAFGPECYSNTFGFDCNSNIFDSYCISNTFDSDCHANTFGPSCSDITFGSSCNFNTFGNGCSNIIFGTASSVKSFCQYIRVGSGNSHLYVNPTGTTSIVQLYQNVEIKEGVNNTTTYKTIDDPNVGQTFLTTYKPANSQEISI